MDYTVTAIDPETGNEYTTAPGISTTSKKKAAQILIQNTRLSNEQLKNAHYKVKQTTDETNNTTTYTYEEISELI